MELLKCTVPLYIPCENGAVIKVTLVINNVSEEKAGEIGRLFIEFGKMAAELLAKEPLVNEQSKGS